MRTYIVLFNPDYYRPENYIHGGGCRFDTLKAAREYARSYTNCRIFSVNANAAPQISNIKNI